MYHCCLRSSFDQSKMATAVPSGKLALVLRYPLTVVSTANDRVLLPQFKCQFKLRMAPCVLILYGDLAAFGKFAISVIQSEFVTQNLGNIS